MWKRAKPPQTSNRDQDLDRQLEAEWKSLQDRWDDYDRRRITIKGWSIVALFGVLHWKDPLGPQGLMVAGAGFLYFWYLEATRLAWQQNYNGRIVEIERYFADKAPKPDEPVAHQPFQTHDHWAKEWNRTGKITVQRMLWDWSTLIPCFPIGVTLLTWPILIRTIPFLWSHLIPLIQHDYALMLSWASHFRIAL